MHSLKQHREGTKTTRNALSSKAKPDQAPSHCASADVPYQPSPGPVEHAPGDEHQLPLTLETAPRTVEAVKSLSHESMLLLSRLLAAEGLSPWVSLHPPTGLMEDHGALPQLIVYALDEYDWRKAGRMGDDWATSTRAFISVIPGQGRRPDSEDLLAASLAARNCFDIFDSFGLSDHAGASPHNYLFHIKLLRITRTHFLGSGVNFDPTGRPVVDYGAISPARLAKVLKKSETLVDGAVRGLCDLLCGCCAECSGALGEIAMEFYRVNDQKG